ncbi:hypothetical protein KC887_01140 [Candidatus Kaiserbacteria bacterium]|nr:hypothetical protein [Candidatus Kaiserbacteria bacterium]
MASFNKINDWVDYMGEDVDLASDQFVVALSNTAPGSESSNPAADGNGVLANVTEVSYTNCSSRNITTSSSSQSSGTYSLVLTDLTLTASGGSVGPFRYVYIYDDTVAGDPLVCYYDYGSSITLADGESIDIDFGSSLFTVA